MRAAALNRGVMRAGRSAPMAAPSYRFYSAEASEAKAQENGGEKSEEKNETGEKSELETLREKYEKKDKEFAELKDRYLRSVADFRNLQNTTAKEIKKARDFALQKFARDLLESVDNFEHALKAVSEDKIAANEEVKNLYEGVKMTQEVFEKTLARHGIEKIDPVGEKFDPNVHEATFEVPQPDKEPGTVFHVQQPGYSLNLRVLRAAKVGVVKGSD